MKDNENYTNKNEDRRFEMIKGFKEKIQKSLKGINTKKLKDFFKKKW